MTARALVAEPLTKAAFAPFGEVIETEGAQIRLINAGTTTRYHDLCRIDVAGGNGRPVLSIFRAKPRPLPIAIEILECHPLGSQAFLPLGGGDWLVVVAEELERHGPGEPAPDPATIRLFRARADQGVSYAPAVWHHPLLVLEQSQDFVVIDRAGPGTATVEHRLAGADRCTIAADPRRR
ncbi:MAG: ureidoglycolate lyase [Hyphomicrobiaceae bacterium]